VLLKMFYYWLGAFHHKFNSTWKKLIIKSCKRIQISIFRALTYKDRTQLTDVPPGRTPRTNQPLELSNANLDPNVVSASENLNEAVLLTNFYNENDLNFSNYYEKLMKRFRRILEGDKKLQLLADSQGPNDLVKNEQNRALPDYGKQFKTFP